MTELPDDPIPISMPARVWNGIYSDVDNAVMLAAEDGDEEVVEIGSEIMETRIHTVVGEDAPGEQVTAILTRAQWQFVLHHNRESTPIYEHLGDEESLELGRLADAVVSRHLGVEPQPPREPSPRTDTTLASTEDREQLDLTFSMPTWGAMHSATEEANRAKDFHAGMKAVSMSQ